MTEEQKNKLIEYAKLIGGDDLKNADSKLLEFAVQDVADRALAYMNREDLPNQTMRAIARAVVGGFKGVSDLSKGEITEQQIASVSDNGQSISYRERAKSYFANAQDSAILTDITPVLDAFRRVTVVSA